MVQHYNNVVIIVSEVRIGKHQCWLHLTEVTCIDQHGDWWLGVL